MSVEDFLYWSAKDLIDAFKLKKISPIEVAKAALDRSRYVQQECNAFTEYFDKIALENAKQAENSYLGKSHDPRPLEGIPLAVKEEFAFINSCRSSGSKIFKDRVDSFTDV